MNNPTDSVFSGNYRMIGKVEDYPQLPAAIKIDHAPFFIVHTNIQAHDEPPQYQLLSASCPHAGGTVRVLEGEFFCPRHFWSFDLSTGISTNVPGEKLTCTPLVIYEGQFAIAET